MEFILSEAKMSSFWVAICGQITQIPAWVLRCVKEKKNKNWRIFDLPSLFSERVSSHVIYRHSKFCVYFFSLLKTCSSWSIFQGICNDSSFWINFWCPHATPLLLAYLDGIFSVLYLYGKTLDNPNFVSDLLYICFLK